MNLPYLNYIASTEELLSIAAEWLAFLLRVREVQGSNPGPVTSYPSQSLQKNAGIVL
jgi:hypothetical protein